MATGFEGLAYPQQVPSPAHFSQFDTEVLDYENDYSGELPTGDVITASSWTADDGLTLSNPQFTASTAKVWVSGGVAGFVYRVANSVSTAGGRVMVKKLFITIKAVEC
jgi:hypothetical protein